jgi:hypothetical protein
MDVKRNRFHVALLRYSSFTPEARTTE